MNPKAIRGYNKNYRRVQGGPRVVRRVRVAAKGPYRKPVASRQSRLPAKVLAARKRSHRDRPFRQTVRTSGSGLRSDYPASIRSWRGRCCSPRWSTRGFASRCGGSGRTR